jgi:cytochrome c biogenesis protein CcmG/thiol:disulfide interchange protein DsbE
VARRLLIVLGALGLVAVVAVGLSQTGGGSGSKARARVPGAAEARRALAGSPPELAALHRQANRLLPGGSDAFSERVKSLKGHPVVVNAWASWCGPCRFELPVFQAQSVRLGKGVAFIGLNVNDSAGAARRFQRTFPVTYPSYVDGDQSISRAFGVQGLPYTVFYDRTGKQVYVHQGPYSNQAQLGRDVRRYALGGARA